MSKVPIVIVPLQSARRSWFLMSEVSLCNAGSHVSIGAEVLEHHGYSPRIQLQDLIEVRSGYRGTSLIRKRLPPLDPLTALGIGLL